MSESLGVLSVIAFFTIALGMPVLGPLALVLLARRHPHWPVFLRVGAACLLPPLAGGALVVMMWLPQFGGQCGGWLGETYACRFAEYAAEAVFWAGMSLAVPSAIACMTVVVTALVLAVRSRARD